VQRVGLRRIACVMDFASVFAWSPTSHQPVGQEDAILRFIHLYLIGYVFLIVGIALALWQVGVLSRIAPIWIGIGALVAIGLGIMLSVSSGKPTMTEELEK